MLGILTVNPSICGISLYSAFFPFFETRDLVEID